MLLLHDLCPWLTFARDMTSAHDFTFAYDMTFVYDMGRGLFNNYVIIFSLIGIAITISIVSDMRWIHVPWYLSQ